MISRLWSLVKTAAYRGMGYTEQVMAARMPGSPNTQAKIAVTEQTALRFAAVYACIRCVSETVGSLPMEVVETNASGAESVTKFHPVAQLLAYEPFEDMTPMVWSETRQGDVMTGGNTYCEVVFGPDAYPIALIPRHWSLVRPFRGDRNELLYEVRQSAGSSNIRVLDKSQMLHVPAFGNGIVGWSPIRLMAETIGIGMAQDKFAASYFGNGSKPSIVIESKGTLSDDAFARLKSEVEQNYSGDNALRPMLLEGETTAKALQIPANEAQLLESREFQEEQICRIYRVPPHMIGLLRRATFSNIEAQDLSYEKHTIRPWLIRHEQEMNRKLFLRSERGRFSVRHYVDDLLRADIKTRYEAYKTAILAGFKSRNEVRQTEHLPPRKGCDELLLPEAIFGKSGGNQKPSKQPSEQNSKRPGRRLLDLTAQTVAGLIAREVTHLERAAAKPEQFAESVLSFYDKHSELLVERLSVAGIPRVAVESAIQRRDQALALANSAHLAIDLASLASTWSSEARSIAKKVIVS